MVLVNSQINLMCECKAVSFVRGILSEKRECHIGGNTADFRFMCVRKMQNFIFSLGATAITLQYTGK